MNLARIQNGLLRAKIRVRDFVVYNALFRSGYVVVQLLRAAIPGTPTPQRLLLLATAYRRCPLNPLRRVVERRLAPWLERDRAGLWRARQGGQHHQRHRRAG